MKTSQLFSFSFSNCSSHQLYFSFFHFSQAEFIGWIIRSKENKTSNLSSISNCDSLCSLHTNAPGKGMNHTAPPPSIFGLNSSKKTGFLALTGNQCRRKIEFKIIVKTMRNHSTTFPRTIMTMCSLKN